MWLQNGSREETGNLTPHMEASASFVTSTPFTPQLRRALL